MSTPLYSSRLYPQKPRARNCSREREGLYNGNVQQNPLCAVSCVTKDIPISPRFPPTFFHRRANPAHYSAQFLIHSSPNRCTLQIRSSLRSQYKIVKCVTVLRSTGPQSRMYSSSTFYAQNPALEIVDQQDERECLSTHACTKGIFMRSILCH